MMDLLYVYLWAMIVLTVFAIVGHILLIGQPRKPVTHGSAAMNVLLAGLNIVAYIVILNRI